MQTSFGSSLASPACGAAVLRAAARRHGLSLGPVTDIELMASVIGAEAWTSITGLTHFNNFWVAGKNSVIVLSSVFSRAAGCPETEFLNPYVFDYTATNIIKDCPTLERVLRRTSSILGSKSAEAVQLAAKDVASSCAPEFLKVSRALLAYDL